MNEIKPGKYKVIELERLGLLLVQDGNHGEYRPRPNEFSSIGTSFIRAADINNGAVLFSSAEKISEIAFKRITKGIGQPGDILLSHKGTVGKLAKVPMSAPPFVCSPQTTFWRTLDNEIIDRNYLYYFMSSSLFHNQLNARKGETDMAPYVSLTAQRDLEILIPEISHQKKISTMLTPIDEKIILTSQASETIELIAKSIFKEWFVDFGPIKAHVEGMIPFAIGADTAALFPKSFVETEFGLVPKTWEIKPLDEVANFLNGLALQKYPPTGNDDLPVIKIAQLRANSTKGSDFASNSVPEPYKISDGDIVFSWSGSLEVKIWTGGVGALNQHLFKVTSEKYPKWFIWLSTLHHLPWFREVAASKATTMGHIQRSHLKEAKVFCPDEKLLSEADKIFGPIFSLLVSNEIENRNLVQARDIILPQIISEGLVYG